MDNKYQDIISSGIIILFLFLLVVAGYISYKSIDWTVLKRMEAQKLILPTPIISSPSAQPQSSIK
jgi:hypothetical protein